MGVEEAKTPIPSARAQRYYDRARTRDLVPDTHPSPSHPEPLHSHSNPAFDLPLTPLHLGSVHSGSRHSSAPNSPRPPFPDSDHSAPGTPRRAYAEPEYDELPERHQHQFSMASHGYGGVQSSGYGGQGPEFKGGDGAVSAEFAGKLEQHLTLQAARADRHRGSISSTLIVPASTCFPKGTPAALWWEAVRGVNQGLFQNDDEQQFDGGIITEIMLLEWELHTLHSLTPDTVVANAAEYREVIWLAIKHLWPEDLRCNPPNRHRLYQHAHQLYLEANPTQAPPNKNAARVDGVFPPMAAEEAALRAEYDTDTFSNDFMRRQFHPALAGLAARRTAIYAAIAAACGRISDEWTRTIAFFSPHAIAQRLTRPPLPPVKYIIAIFKAQWVGVTTAEHNLLLNCKPRHFPTYKQWLSRFKDLVVLTSSEGRSCASTS